MFTWTTEPPIAQDAARDLGLDLPFDTQEDAETWISDAYQELQEAGAEQVVLWNGDQRVYSMDLGEDF
ncbi:MAG: hypothetical protein LBR21_06835 [Propionibacteriaceae bacterium]|jgi:hypothetical protein|nr:hypothetical protein [Propionibacteriaceae bacterium]